MMNLLTRKTKIPMWLMLIGYLVAIGLIVLGFALRQQSAPRPASAAPACSTFTWTISDVIEPSPKGAGYGRITWQRGDQLFQHDFATQKAAGDEVLLELVFDCQAAEGSPDVVPGCICKRLRTTDLLEARDE